MFHDQNSMFAGQILIVNQIILIFADFIIGEPGSGAVSYNYHEDLDQTCVKKFQILQVDPDMQH